jgi:hypothetical protein
MGCLWVFVPLYSAFILLASYGTFDGSILVENGMSKTRDGYCVGIVYI